MVSQIPQDRYSEPFASLNQNYRFTLGSVSKEKHCPSGETLPNGAAGFSFAPRVEFRICTSAKKKPTWEVKNSDAGAEGNSLSSPGPSLAGCIELTLFEELSHYWGAGEPRGVSQEGGKQQGNCMNSKSLISSYN